jgi:hypothetical protein
MSAKSSSSTSHIRLSLGLQREAFAQGARADAGRVERLDHREPPLGFGQRDAEIAGHLAQRHREIAGFVELADQVPRDELGRHVARGRADLGFEMLGESRRVVGALGHVRQLVVEAAAARLRRPVAGVAVPVERFRIDVERRVGLAPAALDQLVGGGILGRLLAHFVGSRRALDAHLAGFEQRIGLQGLANERLDLEVGQRQQLDRLLELRRHHQRLRLP